MNGFLAGCVVVLFVRFAVSYVWAKVRSLLAASGAVFISAAVVWQMFGELR
ncbi:hypothetical protein GCM10009647_003360 [Streptomyces sanglieri]|uniref:Uncharacterized protein n=1 Tax=Streptomyces sanglieri TaxID=193460 RepID=A0ABW2WPT1_9ACTN